MGGAIGNNGPMDTLPQILTLVIATIGAVLGVLNTWRTFSNDRVRLRVMDSMAYGLDGQLAVLIEVRNLSTFPVTVSRVGFHLHGSRNHIQIRDPMLMNGGKLPERLEPRTSLTVLVPVRTLEPDQLLAIKVAYIGTACGLTISSKGAGILQVQHAALTP